MSEKLQKVLARAGVGSRRHMEVAISEGRVSVNGRLAELGDRVEVGDQVRVDGRLVTLLTEEEQRRRVLVYYKPEGEICTRSDPEGRPTVFDHLPPVHQERWILVGRLDVNSSGLLLFTTDGELAHRLMHPSSEIEREYLVRLRGRPRPETLQLLLRGVTLDDGPASFDRIVEQSLPESGPGPYGAARHAAYRVVLHEGRNREVRRLWEAVGHEVSRLLRIRYGPVELPRDLRPGGWRFLEEPLIGALTAAGAKIASRGANSAPKTD